MSSPYAERFHFTRSFVGPLVSADFADHLAPKDPDLAITIENAMLISIDDMVRAASVPLDGTVTGTSDLVYQLKPFYSTSFLAHLSDAAFQFDMVSGETEGSLSDVFFATETPKTWAQRIACAMAAAAEQAADAEMTPRPGHASIVVPPSAAASIPAAGQAGTSSSATAATPTTTATLFDPPVLSTCPIIDIDLVGPNIKAAWMANPVTRAMEDAAVAPIRQDRNWSPTGASLPVYHGTTAPAVNTERAYAHNDIAARITLSNVTPSVLLPMVTPNQMAPAYRALAAIYTGFSPFRCYLWALFHAEVIANIPTGSSVTRNMASRWDCPHPPPHQHRGIRLLKFCPQAGVMSTLPTFVLPDGAQDGWIRRVKEIGDQHQFDPLSIDNEGPTEDLWQLFRDFHGQPAGTPWPSVLHCHEGQLQSRQLKHFTKQLWRTVWHRRDCQVLNASLHSNMAISLTITNSTGTTNDNYQYKTGKRQSL
ncbi:hypothetical protein SPBR_01658 [Sporothrix brasiliensis 5110]|uniref:Uncharacterized protein n=1 Tax=Sporothrix brasiliensis 5110 TaxID=1398154 RepID=A0A0C2J400_9PEZI|nr:uncharacterized protein SPBR_01658 [Sporothrix brasiliensis 5110]KIH91807.1 hypothetical protein SPBR_01658 [Sporothrix brasiliensis 5110]